MDYRIFNVRTDVKCIRLRTRGCTDTVRESALKVDSGRKIPRRTGESNLRQWHACQTLTNWELHPNLADFRKLVCNGNGLRSCSRAKYLKVWYISHWKAVFCFHDNSYRFFVEQNGVSSLLFSFSWVHIFQFCASSTVQSEQSLIVCGWLDSKQQLTNELEMCWLVKCTMICVYAPSSSTQVFHLTTI